MALKYTHVCLFKPVFINVKVNELGPEDGKMS